MRTIVALAATSLLLAACSKEETPATKANPIAFKTVVGHQRGSAASQGPGGNLQQDFGVFVYRNAEGAARPDASINSLHNEAVRYTPNGFEYSNTIYWPESDKMGFYAYSPYSDGNGTAGISQFVPANQTTPGILAFSFTVDPATASQTDLLVARKEGLSGGTVPLEFQHALARIGIAAHTSGTNYRVAILSIRFEGLLSQGLFRFADYDAPWSNQQTPANYTGLLQTNGSARPDGSGASAVIIPYSADINQYTPVTDPDNALYLLPQPLHAGMHLVLTYNIYNAATGFLLTATDAVEAVVEIGNPAVSPLLEWKKGTSITYKLNFTPRPSGPGSEIQFNASVINWDTDDSTIG